MNALIIWTGSTSTSTPAPGPEITWAGTVNATLGIIGAAISIALGALLVWGATALWRRFVRPRAVMRMKVGMGNAWQIENVTRRTLLNAEWIAVASGGANLMPSWAQLGMPDFRPRAPMALGSFPSGTTLSFNWIDKGGRRHAEVRLKDGVEEISIVPEKLPRRRLRFDR